MRHGLRATAAFVPGLERRQDWERHRGALLDVLEPLGALEEALAERVALLLWRLDRVTRYERESIHEGYESVERELILGARAKAILDPVGLHHPVDVADFYQAARDNVGLLKKLGGLPADELVSSERAESILYAVEDYFGVKLDDVSLPGVPDEVPLDKVAWTAGLLREALAYMAKAGGRAPDEGIVHALRRSFADADRLKKAGREIEATRLRFRRERILPDAAALEKISRYEAHLDRVLVRTLHELHRLQAARGRSAAPAPVALDVDLTVTPSSTRKCAPVVLEGEEA